MRAMATASAVLLLLLAAVIAPPAMAARVQLGPRQQQLQQRLHQQQGQHAKAKGQTPPLTKLGTPTPPAQCDRAKTPYEEVHYASQYRVVDYKNNCASKENQPCTDYAMSVVNDTNAPRTGCDLLAKAQYYCKNYGGSPSCPTGAGFAYSDNYGGCEHVITIASDPIRGLEDIWQKGVPASVQNHWLKFWDDNLAHNAGLKGKSGFDADMGALVINPAAHREYHQLHIHGGVWRTKAFDTCLDALPLANVKPNVWHESHCTGLSEGGSGKNPVTAYLAYQVINQKDLDKAWALWKEAVKDKVNVKDSVTGNQLSPNDAAFFSGLLVTRRSQHTLSNNEVIVAAYWPATNKKADGLGRGHFVMKGKPGTTCP